jgi:hypothetical protein
MPFDFLFTAVQTTSIPFFAYNPTILQLLTLDNDDNDCQLSLPLLLHLRS